MSERNPYFGFGVNDVTLYQITDGSTLAHLRCIGDVQGDFSAETAKVEGGSQNYPWKVNITGFKGSLKLKVKEYSPEAMAIFMGGTLTNYVAAPTGDIVDEANVKGTTLLSATGFASVGVATGHEANLKPGWYMAKAVSSSTFDLYAYTSAHFGRGTSVVSQDNFLKLTSAPLTIPSTPAETVEIENLGLVFTRGATALSVTSGDTFRFFVQSPFTSAFKLKFGQNSSSFSDVGVIVGGERSDNEGLMLHLFRCKCLGGPLNFTRKGFAECDINIEPQYDSTLDGVGEFVGIRE